MPGGKSSKGSSAESAAHLPVLVDPRLVKALDHVLRQHILLAAVTGEVSPSELSKALGEGLSQVSYHFRVLREDCDGMIEETRREQRRGAMEHYYRATARTLLPAKAWRGLRKGLRAVVGAGQASDLFNDLADALQAGKLQGACDRIIRTPLVLDAEGQRNVQAIAERAAREVEDEQRATAKRVEKGNGGRLAGYTFALLAFEAAWRPANLPPPVEEGTAGASANGVSDTAAAATRGRGEGAKRRRRSSPRQ